VPHVRGVVSKTLPRNGVRTPVNLVPPEHRWKVVANTQEVATESISPPSVMPSGYYMVPCLVYMHTPSFNGQRLYDSRAPATENQYTAVPADITPLRWDAADYRRHNNNKGRRQYSTAAEVVPTTEKIRPPWSVPAPPSPCNFNNDMTLDQFYIEIMKSFAAYKNCKLSWFHRMLAKVETKADFERAKTVWNQYVQHCHAITSETSTLIVKASCKAGIPNDGLEVLSALIEHEQYWPSTAGVQYLMINLSLNKETEAVMKAYNICKKKGFKMTPKTFHIVIRECIENGMIDEAFMFAEEAKEMGVEMNRVIYNILMNGCRTHELPEKIIQLREEMDNQNIEINDSTIKFTSLAYLAMNKKEEAVQSFQQYEKLGMTLEEFCAKFIVDETEDATQKEHVKQLFQVVREAGVDLPESAIKDF